MNKLSLVKRSLLLFMIGFILSISIFMVSAGTAYGDSYNWKDGNTNFSNSATVTTDFFIIVGGAGIVSSDNEPTGYLGARANILNESYVIKVTGAWEYTTAPSHDQGGTSSLQNAANGNYAVQGETRYYRSGSYKSMWTYITPFQKFPD